MYLDFKNSVQSTNYSYEQVPAEKSVKVDEIAPSTADTNNNSSSGNQKALNPTTVRALEAANLPVNEKNIELVESMMREGLKIDKESIQNMYRMLLKYPQLDSSTLIHLKALDIPINDATIHQLESYKNQNHQITQGLQAVSDGIWKACLDLFETGTSRNMQNSLLLLGEMMQGTDVPEKTVNFVTTAAELMAIMENLQGQADNKTTGDSGNLTLAGDMVNSGVASHVGEGMKNGDMAPAVDASDGNDAIRMDTVMQQGKGVQENKLLFLEKVQELIKIFLPSEDPLILEQKLAEINSNRGLLQEMQRLESILLGIPIADELLIQNQNARNHDALLMNVLGYGQEGQLQLTSQQITEPQMPMDNQMEQLVKDIKAFLETEVGSGKQNVQAYAMGVNEISGIENHIKDLVKLVLFDNKELMWHVKDKFSQSILLNPEDVADQKKVLELYDNLNQKLNQMGKILADAGLTQSQTAQPLMHMQENIQFINQLNQVFQYVQIPLRMFEKDVCGELCVYTNKKHLAQSDGNLSAFLHLDMEFMGPVDVYVSLQKGNFVSTNFYLKDDETLDFINEHIHMLDERLERKGYNVRTKLSVREEEGENSVLDHMLNHKSVDVRTKLLSVNSFDTLI